MDLSYYFPHSFHLYNKNIIDSALILPHKKQHYNFRCNAAFHHLFYLFGYYLNCLLQLIINVLF